MTDYIKHPRIGAEVRIRGRAGVWRVTAVQPQDPLYRVEPVEGCDSPLGPYSTIAFNIMPLSTEQQESDMSLYNPRRKA